MTNNESTSEHVSDSEQLLTSTDESSSEVILSREQQLEVESRALFNRVVSNNIDNIKDRVAFILNTYPDTRNSDIELAWIYWNSFEAEKYDGHSITKEQMFALTKPSSLTRIRAKIQNEYKLFQADPSVRKFRGTLEEENRLDAVEERPSNTGVYSVYIDETGKTQDYLSVGSLWLLNYGTSHILKSYELKEWKKASQIEYEFHFTEVTKNKVDSFKNFFLKFLTLFPDVGFKLIFVNNKDLSDKNQAITDLTFHLIQRGVEHENNSGRAPLPRRLSVLIDDEEKGSDQLKLANIKERIGNQKVKGLYLGEFEAVDSSINFFIQAVDLFTGAVNRKLHNPGGTHFKDELADYILSLVNFDTSNVNKDNTSIDSSMIFDLSSQSPQTTI